MFADMGDHIVAPHNGIMSNSGYFSAFGGRSPFSRIRCMPDETAPEITIGRTSRM